MTRFQILVGSAYEPGHFGEGEVRIAIFNRLEKPSVRLDLIITLTFGVSYADFRRIRNVVKRTDQKSDQGIARRPRKHVVETPVLLRIGVARYGQRLESGQ